MEFMPNFTLHRPESVADAVRLRTEEADALYVAGGTDMLVNVRRGIEQPKALIDLSGIEEIKSIADDEHGLHIGAGVRLSELANHPTVIASYGAVAEAARAVAGPTHQNYGTVGGNLCLDTRCLFYNQSEWWRKSNDYCLKERGEICHVAPGGKRCFAAFSGDVAPAMLVHDATVDILGTDGMRTIPLGDLYRADGMNHLTLSPGEMVVRVHLPKSSAGVPSSYEKNRVRGSIDYPLAGVAVWLKQSGGKVEELRIATTGVNTHPGWIKNLEKFSGKALDEAALDEIREMVRSQSRPMRTTTVKPWYRRRVVGAIARRLCARLAVG